MITVLKVEGMVCNHCAGIVKGELMEHSGVKDVLVDITAKEGKIEHDEKANIKKPKDAIEDLGYEVV